MRLQPGQRVFFADGAGRPSALSARLSEAAREAGGIRLILGFVPSPDPDLDLSAFADVRTLMSGWGLRKDIDAGCIRYVPNRIGNIPSLFAGPLRPDVVVVSVVETPQGLTLGSEVSFMRAAIATGARVVGVLRTAIPACDAGPPLTGVELLAEDDSPPVMVPSPRCSPEYVAIGKAVAALVPDEASLQIGPGPLGAAVLAGIERPVTIDSGMIVDAIVPLDERGLLTDMRMASYLHGTRALYDWAQGRKFLNGVEITHHPGRLIDGGPFIAVNTALEIDIHGAVNVERIGGSAVGGIGGHPDYAAAGARSVGGLSIIGIPTFFGERPMLVQRLSYPASTASHDVDIVVTERGHLDLRGLDRSERSAALLGHWDGAVSS